MDEKIVARVLALLDRCAKALEGMAAAQKRYADVDCPQQAPLGPVGPPRGDAWEPPAARAKPEAAKGRGEDKPHAPPLEGLPEAQKVVAETARSMAEAAAKPDLVDWAAPPTTSLDALRARLFALLRAKLGLAGEGASLEARRRCVVESTAKATAEDLRSGIESLAGLPDFVAPALPAGPISSYTAEAGRARGCSVALAAKLAELEPENKAPSLAELTTIHAQPVLAAAKAKAGIPAGSRARDVAEARLVVMALPVVESKEVKS